MHSLFRLPLFSSVLLGAGLLLSSPVARAQTAVPAGAVAAHGYDFLTMTTVEGTKAFSLILFSPEFQGKTEIPLVYSGLVGADRFKEIFRQNTQLINEQLSALTVAG